MINKLLKIVPFRRTRICKAKLPIISKTIVNIADLEIEFQKKKVRNINLRIAKDGKIIASASQKTKFEDVQKFIILKSNWLREKRQEIKERTIVNKTSINLLKTEKILFLGKEYDVKFIMAKSSKVEVSEDLANIYCKENATLEQKLAIIEKFYRQELEKLISQFIDRYSSLMNLMVSGFGIKKMKTRWGSCNIRKKFIWINLELSKKPIICLESLVVHEMTHLLEVKHNRRFYNLMEHFMPNWREGDKLLKGL
ncbi:MAG: M48 family metallopeptidase [Pelagibacterales bacterium]|nr:M48 family metallopeptidase [Pelagibacterales bacterium]